MTRAPLRRSSPSWFGRVALVVLVAVCAWGVGLVWFASSIPQHPAESNAETDAIVVLTGGSGRLDEGIRLLGQGLADKLFVSGVYQGVDVKTLIELSRENPADLSCCISIGYAENTIANADETSDWVKANRIDTIRLVTAAYHMPRSLLEFSNAMPGMEIVPHPVFPAHVKQDRWWLWPGTTGLIVREYNKFIAAWLRHRIVDVTGRTMRVRE